MKLLHSMVLHGIQGLVIDIEVDVQSGIPSFNIVGLGDTAIQESRERIRSAVKNSKYSYPSGRVTVNLAPAHIPKTGSHLDLAIALGLMSEVSLSKEAESLLILGELSLDGKLKPLIGALPLVISGKKQGFTRFLIPYENYLEVSRIQGIECIPLHSLTEAIIFLKTRKIPPLPIEIPFQEISSTSIPFESIIGQSQTKRALMIAAAGGHNILMEGPPGSGKSMLATALQGILPKMTQEEALEVAQIYSIAGIIDKMTGTNRPFRHIHHTASITSIIGGGKYCRPGEISLAHHGVLFLDEFLEFGKQTLESLREPIESREIHISRIHGTYTYPASFMLVGAMNPCPCGYFGDVDHTCTDTAAEIARYRSRLSGPILDRMDIFVKVPRVPIQEIHTKSPASLSSKEAKEIVEEACQCSLERQGKINSRLTIEDLSLLSIESDALSLLRSAVERLSLSLRAYHRILRVSRTIADLETSKKITSAHVAEAIGYRQN